MLLNSATCPQLKTRC